MMNFAFNMDSEVVAQNDTDEQEEGQERLLDYSFFW